MSDAVSSIFFSTIGLQIAFLAALALATRPLGSSRAARAAAVVLLIQLMHFAEEWRTGFAERLPTFLGLAPWPQWFFPTFNIAWFALWTAAIVDRGSSYPARTALWFLAIAAIVNGVAHPLLALRYGEYFPGLFTSPLLGVAGIWLAIRLRERAQSGA